jgi:hypothetical protein
VQKRPPQGGGTNTQTNGRVKSERLESFNEPHLQIVPFTQSQFGE